MEYGNFHRALSGGGGTNATRAFPRGFHTEHFSVIVELHGSIKRWAEATAKRPTIDKPRSSLGQRSRQLQILLS